MSQSIPVVHGTSYNPELPQTGSEMASQTSLTKVEVRLLACAQPELSKWAVDSKMLEKKCPLDNGRVVRPSDSQFNTQISPLDLGSLRALPLDIIYMILDLVDLKSLTDFRMVSWGTRALIDSVPQYQTVIQYAPNAIRALLSTGMAAHFTARDLSEVLCIQSCFSCEQFGPFLDLFTCRRYCVTCVSFSDDLLTIKSYRVKMELEVDWHTINTFPSLFSLSNQFNDKEPAQQMRISLVRVQSAIRAAHELGLRRRFEIPGTFLLQPPLQIPTLHERLVRWDSHKSNKYRFMPMLRFPVLDRRTGLLEWGVSCQACRLGPQDDSRQHHGCEILYSAAGYLEHFQKCEASQIARKAIPDYIAPILDDQPIFDARFLEFLSDLGLKLLYNKLE